MTGAHKKFVFDTEFADGGQAVRSEALRMTYKREEVEVIRAEAYEQGRDDTIAQAEVEAAAALRDLAIQSRGVMQEMKRQIKTLREEYMQLAVTVGEALSAGALQQVPEAAVHAVIDAALVELRQAPRLIVRLPAGTAEKLTPKITDLAEEMGLSGQMLVREDPAAVVGDCRIEWADGAAAFDGTSLRATVAALVAQHLNTSQTETEHGQ